ncbi:MAG: hypothetical protein P4L60_28290 [Clostridium sp.]|nr:hypothetical protein [Clostridium sp.]
MPNVIIKLNNDVIKNNEREASDDEDSLFLHCYVTTCNITM